MAKTVHNNVLDAALSHIANNCTRMVACSAQPTTFTEANVTYALADVTMAPSDFTGPAEGSPSGRQLQVNAKSGVTIDIEGNPTVIALLDVANSLILYTTDENSAQTLYVGNTTNFPAWVITIEDPA